MATIASVRLRSITKLELDFQLFASIVHLPALPPAMPRAERPHVLRATQGNIAPNELQGTTTTTTNQTVKLAMPAARYA